VKVGKVEVCNDVKSTKDGPCFRTSLRLVSHDPFWSLSPSYHTGVSEDTSMSSEMEVLSVFGVCIHEEGQMRASTPVRMDFNVSRWTVVDPGYSSRNEHSHNIIPRAADMLFQLLRPDS
jgi:hypothetical protein